MAEYTALLAVGRLPAIDPVNTTWPSPRAIMPGSTVNVACTAARRLMSISASATAVDD